MKQTIELIAVCRNPDNPDGLWHAPIKDHLRQMVPQRRPIAPFTAYLHQVFENFQRAFASDFSLVLSVFKRTVTYVRGDPAFTRPLNG